MARVMIPNLSEYERQGALDAGLYEVMCASAEDTISQQKGTRGLSLDLVVVNGPTQADGSEPMGRHIFQTLWYPHSGMKDGGKFAGVMLREACECFGVRYDNTGFDNEEFLDRQGTIKTKIDNSGDQPRESVSKFYAARG